MKRLLPILVRAAALFSTSLSAAPVTSSVGFLTKGGQRPILEETLLWLEPVAVAGKSASGAFLADLDAVQISSAAAAA